MTKEQLYSLISSGLLTAMLWSTQTKPGVQLAGTSGLGQSAQTYASALTGSAPAPQPAVGSINAVSEVRPAQSRTAADDLLETLTMHTLTFGDDARIPAGLCTPLGACENQPLQGKQIAFTHDADAVGRQFNVASKADGSLEVVLGELKEPTLTLYRTNKQGRLIKAIKAVRKGPTEVLDNAAIQAEFKKQLDFWKAREPQLRRPQVSSR